MSQKIPTRSGCRDDSPARSPTQFPLSFNSFNASTGHTPHPLRAVRYGRETLGAKEGFLAGLVDVVVAHFGEFFPELVRHRDTIYDVLLEEEASFSKTLVKGE